MGERRKFCSKDFVHSLKNSGESVLVSLGPWTKLSVRKLNFILEEHCMVARFVCMPLKTVFFLYILHQFSSVIFSLEANSHSRALECTAALAIFSAGCLLALSTIAKVSCSMRGKHFRAYCSQAQRSSRALHQPGAVHLLLQPETLIHTLKTVAGI